MKRILLVSVIAFSASIMAQPVITKSVLPGLNTSVQLKDLDLSSFTLGDSGAAVTWVYSGITSNKDVTLDYKSPDDVAESKDFPGCNIVGISSEGITTFNTNFDDQIADAGIIVDGLYKEVLSGDERINCRFPITYEDTFHANFSGTNDFLGGLPISVTRDGTTFIKADAYGTLVMPYDSIEDVLRVRAIHVYQDFQGSTLYANYWDTTYYYYAEGNRLPILTYNINVTELVVLSQPPATTITGLFLAEENVGLQKIENNLGFNVYPNPSTGMINVEWNRTYREAGRISITDLRGKVVLVRDFDRDAQSISLDTEGLEKGTYLLRLTSESGQGVKQIVIN